MLKKYVLKVSNTLSTINYIRPTQSRSSTSDDDGHSACSCDWDYNLMEVNRDLFIENYLIGRGSQKMRSSSLSSAEDAMREAKRNNHRRKSLMEKRDDRLKINRNRLFSDRSDRNDRAVTRHKMSVDSFDEDDYYEVEAEKSRGCDYFETSAPTLKKINNKLRDFLDVELSKFQEFFSLSF